jgi:hypothetical protein
MAVVLQDFTIYRGTAALLVFTRTTNGSIAGQNVRFSVRKHRSDPDPLLIDVPATHTDEGSVSTPAVVSVALSKAQTLALAAGTYAYSLERTDGGAESLWTIGKMTVELDVRNAA